MYDPLQVYITSSTLDFYNPPQCTYGGSGYYTRLPYRGQEWYRNLAITGYYNHTLTPNNRWWDCGDSIYTNFHLAARSYHPGGVNVGFADGSVKFVKDSVNINTWRGLGSRAGSEVIDASGY
jgi:prepilin-type processing-associated H-X9-DG protein